MASRGLVRKIALSLHDVTEIDHWGRPAYRTRKRIFAVLRPDGLYLHLPDERKEFLFEADPKTFVKYMWGKTPNVIVQLDRVLRGELENLICEAWKSASPRKESRATAGPAASVVCAGKPKKKKGGARRPSV